MYQNLIAGLPLTCNKTSHNGPIEPGMVSFERYASSLMGNVQFPLFWYIKEPQKEVFLSSPRKDGLIWPQKMDGLKLTFLYIKSAQTVDTYNNITICDMCHDHVSMTMSCVLNVDMFVRRQNLSSTLKLSWALQNSLWLLLRTALPFLGGSVGAKKNQRNISLQGLYKWTLILNTIEVLMV